LVVDGLGAAYVYPEHSAYALDGAPLGDVVLFNLTGGGARAVDVRVPVPETSKSHSILVTGSSGADSEALGPTIFDAARKKGYLCLAVLERGDSMAVLQEQDAVLYLDNNALHGAEPIVGFRDSVPQGLRSLFQEWRDRFKDYTAPQGLAGYQGYNQWGLDAAADIVEHLAGRQFLMLVNVGAVDSAGQNLGAEGYLETVSALDAPLGELAEACQKSGVILAVTADHGMSFPALRGKGGHSATKYSSRLESLRVPLVFQGPGVEELNLGGQWSETDIAPTVLDFLGIPENISREGRSLPIKKSYSLRITGAPGLVSLSRDGRPLANASGDEEYNFRGLARGLYTVQANGRSQEVLVNGNLVLDLAGKGGNYAQFRKILGLILILAINLTGALLIIRIWRKG